MYWCGSDTIVVVCRARKEGCIRRLLLRLLVITSTDACWLPFALVSDHNNIIFSTMVTVESNICFLVKHLLCSHVRTIYLTVWEHIADIGQYMNRHVLGVLCFKFPCYASDHRQVLRRLNYAKMKYGISLSVKLITTFRNQVLGYFWPMYYCVE